MKAFIGRERITFDDAAEQLGITRRTLFLWVAAGKFARPYRVGRKNFYFADEFNAACVELLNGRNFQESEK